MKTVALFIAGALTCWAATSSKIRTSLGIAGESLEDRIVSAAGRGAVAIRLNEKRLAELRGAAIQAKSIRAHYNSQFGISEGDIGEDSVSSEQEMHQTRKRLKKLEDVAVRQYREETRKHLLLKSKLRRLENQLVVVRALSKGIESVRDASRTSDLMNTTSDSLELELLRAEAELQLNFEDLGATQ